MKDDMKMYLYSGCRHQNGDYIYRDEFKTYIESGLLQGHYMAFSRDQVFNYLIKNKNKKNSRVKKYTSRIWLKKIKMMSIKF